MFEVALGTEEIPLPKKVVLIIERAFLKVASELGHGAVAVSGPVITSRSAALARVHQLLTTLPIDSRRALEAVGADEHAATLIMAVLTGRSTLQDADDFLRYTLRATKRGVSDGGGGPPLGRTPVFETHESAGEITTELDGATVLHALLREVLDEPLEGVTPRTPPYAPRDAAEAARVAQSAAQLIDAQRKRILKRDDPSRPMSAFEAEFAGRVDVERLYRDSLASLKGLVAAIEQIGPADDALQAHLEKTLVELPEHGTPESLGLALDEAMAMLNAVPSPGETAGTEAPSPTHPFRPRRKALQASWRDLIRHYRIAIRSEPNRLDQAEQVLVHCTVKLLQDLAASFKEGQVLKRWLDHEAAALELSLSRTGIAESADEAERAVHRIEDGLHAFG